ESGKPRNPMINAGAIAAASLVRGASAAERFERVRQFYSGCAGRELQIDEAMYASEDRTGFRNRAISYLLRSSNVIEEDPQLSLDVYFRQCSLAVTCADLAMMAATLADSGMQPITGERLVSPSIVERVLGVMTTCGMYDDAGDWVTAVGLPAKCGVGGGILAVLPGQLGLAVFSPPLDRHGASVRGTQACRTVSQELGLHFMHVARPARTAIRSCHDLTRLSSPRRRNAQETEVLQQYGSRAVVYQLHGDLLFTETESVIREVTARAAELDLLVVDVRDVVEVSPIARKLLGELQIRLTAQGCELVLVDPASTFDPDPSRPRMVGLNSALEYCEERLLQTYGSGLAPQRIALEDHPAVRGLTATQLAEFADRTTPLDFTDGQPVIDHGVMPPGALLIMSGRVEVALPDGDGSPRHLYTSTAGATLGVAPTFTAQLPVIEARAVGPVHALVVSSAGMAQLSEQAPHTAIALLRNLLVSAGELVDRFAGRPNSPASDLR
ncbi:MAG: glutaminase, partial [Mycobacteriaceae bacterium]